MKKEGKNKEGEKKNKLLNRMLNYDYYWPSFNHYRELWDYYEGKINVFKLD